MHAHLSRSYTLFPHHPLAPETHSPVFVTQKLQKAKRNRIIRTKYKEKKKGKRKSMSIVENSLGPVSAIGNGNHTEFPPG